MKIVNYVLNLNIFIIQPFSFKFFHDSSNPITRNLHISDPRIFLWYLGFSRKEMDRVLFIITNKANQHDLNIYEYLLKHVLVLLFLDYLCIYK